MTFSILGRKQPNNKPNNHLLLNSLCHNTLAFKFQITKREKVVEKHKDLDHWFDAISLNKD